VSLPSHFHPTAIPLPSSLRALTFECFPLSTLPRLADTQTDSHNWLQPTGNNGLLKEHPTASSGLTKAVFSNGNIGQNLTSRFSFGVDDQNWIAADNYGLRPSAQANYNDGLHVVNGSSAATNTNGRTYFSVLDVQQQY
jgi:hypothetical protein